jgi:sugar lactone lactonase YvrE
MAPAAAWTATSSAPWLTVNPASGSAGATVTFDYTANSGTRARTAVISIAGASFTVWQIGSTGAYNQWANGAYGEIHTIAGGGSPSNSDGDGGLATGAGLTPNSVAVDANGNLFVADVANHAVRRVDAVTGIITNVAPNRDFFNPAGLTLDSAGNLYIADSQLCEVYRVDLATQAIQTIAGTGSCAYAGDGGPATAAALNSPTSIAFDSKGNLYIADSGNQRIRVVNAATGNIATAAGTGTPGFSGDGGLATAATLSNPTAVAVDTNGNIFIADTGNARLRKIDAATGKISTVAGNGASVGGNGGPATSAGLDFPAGVAIDAAGNLYIAESGGDVRKVNASTGIITSIAGGSVGFAQPGSGSQGIPATEAYIGNVHQIAVDSAGNLYIAARFVYFVDFATPQVTLSVSVESVGTAAGGGTLGLTLSSPEAIWIASSDAAWLTLNPGSGKGSGTIGYSYAANNTPYTRTGLVITEGEAFTLTQTGISVSLSPNTALAGTGAGSGKATLTAPATVTWTAVSNSPWLTVTPASGTGSATLNYQYTGNTAPVSRAGTITVLGRTLGISQAGTAELFTTWGTAAYGIVTTIAGGGTGLPIYDNGNGGPATSATLSYPKGVAVDGSGNVYISDFNSVRRVDAATKIITAFAGVASPSAVAVDASGNVFVAEYGGNVSSVFRVDAKTGIITTVAGTGVQGFGGDLGPATAAQMNGPTGIAVDGAGNLYICDSVNYRVRRVDAVSGIITTIAGTGVAGTAGNGGPATAAELDGLSGIALDSQGNVFIADGFAIRRIDAVTGIITGLQTPTWPQGLAFDAAGNLYASGGSPIWKVDWSTGTLTVLGGSIGRGGFSGDGGPVTYAQFSNPLGLATDAEGNLYIVDAGNGRVRFVDFTSPQVALKTASTAVPHGSGTGSVAITVTPAGALWLASSNASWLTLTATQGTGSGSIGYSFTANPSVFTRTAIITVAGQALVFTQPGSTVTLSSPIALAGSAASSGTVKVTVSPAAAWIAQSSAAWLSVSPPSGNGNATLQYSLTKNSSADARVAAITVAGRNFTVVQSGGTGSWIPWGTGSAYGQIRRIAGPGTNTSEDGDYGPALAAAVSPNGIATDLNGNVFFSDARSVVRRIDAATGIVAPAAGSGINGFGGDGGSALAASLQGPLGIAIDSASNLYIADSQNNRIRRVDAATRIITTIAGSGAAGFTGDDGPATLAALSSPASLAVDGAGNVFVGDSLFRVRRIDGQTGAITTVAGTGTSGYSGDNGPATAAQISGTGVAVDGAGNLYIDDAAGAGAGNRRIRRVDAVTGIITTVAGTGVNGDSGDGVPATQAMLQGPMSLVSDAAGNLFFMDGNVRLRRVDAASGLIDTVAGSTATGYSEDGGPALLSPVQPGPLAVDGAGNVYLTGANFALGNSPSITLRAIDFTTPLAVFAASAVSSPAGGSNGSVGIIVPADVAWTATSSATWLTLTSATGAGSGTVAYTLAPNNTPFSRTAVILLNGQVVTVTQAGVAVSLSASSATVTSAAGSGTLKLTTTAAWTVVSSAPWLTVTPSSGTGNATLTYSFTANGGTNGRIAALTVAGRAFGVVQPSTQGRFTPWGSSGQGLVQTIAGIGTSSTYSSDGGAAIAAGIHPSAVATDANGNVWIADTAGGRVRKVNSATGIISTVAGNGTPGSTGDGGSALSAQVAPGAVAVDVSGNLYIADTAYNRIRRVNTSTGVITTVAGGGQGGDGSLATQASLNGPLGLFVDAAGNIFLADQYNDRIRRVDAASGVITTVAGTGVWGYPGNGVPATATPLEQPTTVALDPNGNILLPGGEGVLRVDSGGIITPLASVFGGASLGLTVDGAGHIYVTTPFANGTAASVEAVDPVSGVLTPVAGTPVPGFSGDGGPAIAAQFSDPSNTSTDGGGNLYIADTGNGRVRFVDRVTPAVVLGAATASVGAAAGTGTVSVTVTPAGSVWSASSNAAWLVLTTATGAGSGSIGYNFLANTSPDARMGVISVMGRTLSVNQAGSALAGSTVTLTPAFVRVGASAGSGTFQLAVSPAASWTASSSANWLTVSPASGNADATVSYKFSANTSAAGRTATITAGGRSFAVAQLGSSGAYTAWGPTFNGEIVTIAGNGSSAYSGDNGAATLAGIGLGSQQGFYGPAGTAIDGNGNVFLAEPLNHRIRRVDGATGLITTVAGNGSPGADGDGGPAVSAQLNQPRDVKVDAGGNLYIADSGNNKIRRVDGTTGIVTTIAGTGAPTPQYTTIGWSGCSGGPAVSATLNGPNGVALDRLGNLFISDTGDNCVLRVDALTGIISAIAGHGASGFAGDGGAATAANLAFPEGLAIDGSGNLYIADMDNNRIRRVDAVSGKISTVAGNGQYFYSGDNGPATSAGIYQPEGIAVDGSGNLYIADTQDQRIRRVDGKTGIITTLAGNGYVEYSSSSGGLGDGGPATSAAFAFPGSVTCDASGNVYISDNVDERVRLVDTASPVITFASPSVIVSNAAGSGSVGITVSPAGGLWSATSTASWLTPTTANGTGSGTVTFSFTLNAGTELRTAAILVYGQVFVVSQPGMTLAPSSASVAPQSAVVAAAAGSGTFALTITAGIAWQAASSASWLTVSPAIGSGSATLTYTFTANPQANARIATINVAGVAFGVTQTSVSGSYVPWGQSGYGSLYLLPGVTEANGMAVDSNGDVLFSQFPGDVARADAVSGIVSTVAGNGVCCGSTGDGGPATAAMMYDPAGIALDSGGNLFIALPTSGLIRRVDASTQIISTFAGNGTDGSSGDGGPAGKSALSPWGLTIDPAGNIYVADAFNSRVRFVNGATGIISTLAGTGPIGYSSGGFSGDGGPATAAQVKNPSGTAVDRKGNVYVVDTGNNRIRRINSSGVISTVAGTGTRGLSGDGGPATKAELASPSAVAVDAAGNLYIADAGNNLVRRVDTTSGVITTYAGGGAGASGSPALSASLLAPFGLAFDAAGNLYIGDSNGIHFLDLTSPRITFTPESASVAASSGTGSAAFTITPAGAAWSAVSTDSWLTVTTPAGTGPGAVGYSLSANPTPYPRTGSILMRGQSYTLTQVGISAAFSPPSAAIGAAAGSANATLSVPAPVAWNATSNAAWLTASPPSGTGTAILTYHFSANTAAGPRSGEITVMGQTFLVVQAGTAGTWVPAYTPWKTSFPGEITTIAGNGQVGFSGDGGPAIVASFGGDPAGLAIDGAGNVYVADSNSNNYTPNNRIRKVAAATGIITTIAGNGSSNWGGDGGPATDASVVPSRMAFSPAGDLYFTEPSTERIRRIDGHTGIITTVAGNGTSGFSGDGGLAIDASLWLGGPASITVDAAGNIYFVDGANTKVRRVDGTTGIISTVVGGGQSAGTGIAGITVALNNPIAVVADRNGNLFVFDATGTSRAGPRILRLDTTSGLVWVLNLSGPALPAGVGDFQDMAADAAGNLYVADGGNVLRINAQTGVSTTVAGNVSETGPFGDGGLATNAALSASAIALDGAGNLYIGGSLRVRFVDFATPLVTLPAVTSIGEAAGTGSVPMNAPAGAQWSASTNASWLTVTTPSGAGAGKIAFSFAANLTAFPRVATITVLGQTGNVVQAGIVVTLSSVSATLPAGAANGPLTLTIAPSAAWAATSSAAWLTVSPASGSASTTLKYSVAANSSGLPRMATITVLGRMFRVLQAGITGNYTPYGFSAAGEINTAAGGGNSLPFAVATDSNGNLYIVSNDALVRKVDISSGIISIAAGNGATAFSGDGGPAIKAGIAPTGIAIDAAGNMFIADGGNNRIRRVSSTGIITTIAGTGTAGFGGDGGPAAQATLDQPNALALDAQGNLYFVDGFVDGGARVRRIDQGTGIVTTVGGNGDVPNYNSAPADGTKATQIGLACFALATDGTGNVYCSDPNATQRVFKIDTASGAIMTAAGGGSTTSATFTGDGGPGVSAVLSSPSGLAFDAAGNLYIGEEYADKIRRVDGVTGIITTVAGNGVNGSSGDGGPATAAELYYPLGLATDPAGNLYFADSVNRRVRFIDFSTPAAGHTAQAITFAALATVTLPAVPFTLTASANSGLPVSFISNTKSICTVSGSTLTAIEAGTCSITAGQTGNATYAAATPVTRTFLVSGGPPAVVSLSPNSGAGTSVTLNAVYSDPNGAGDLSELLLQVNTSQSSANACYVYYQPQGNHLYLANNAGAWITPALTAGVPGTAANSQCTLTAVSSSVTTAGNDMTLAVALTFSGTFMGAKNVYLYAAGASGQNSGWVKKGTWTR